MTDTDLITAPSVADDQGAPKTKTRAGLSGMVLTELRSLAGELGIKGTSGMRKGDLIAAIKERQGAGTAAADAHKATSQQATAPKAETTDVEAPRAARSATRRTKTATSADSAPEQMTITSETTANPQSGSSADTTSADSANGASVESSAQSTRTDSGQSNNDHGGSSRGDSSRGDDLRGDNARGDNGRGESDNATNQGGGNNRNRARNRNGGQGGSNSNGSNSAQQGSSNQGGNNNQGGGNQSGEGGQNSGKNQGPNNNRDNNNRDDDGEGGRGRRGRRFRERRRGRDRDGSGGGEPQISDDDVLQPVAGILDVLDNYAFVRTSGYLAGPNDVYVSMNLVRKNGLRRGDAITGAVKVPRDGEQQNQRQKFNPLVRLDSVNESDVESARKRPDFNKLTPLYPNQRLRLETAKEQLDTRVIDLIMPIGKGQRALIVSPPKAGKTTILQDIANAIAINNPECHLMVVLVDERPEEVTDMQRSVKGEVIASTFDRPPSDHTSVSELAIERAKRLVEQGTDVVVLLDSITRLGRAYNNASPASGRILSGGVDSTALYPPKRFLGAARNIENGGSLTIIASALVETGSTGDTVIFEEFKGTSNAELKLDRKIADRRVFPAVDVNQSSTRKDELLMSPEEFGIMHKLRRVLSGLDSQQAIDLLISQLKKTKNNYEFLLQVQSNAPGAMKDD
ncbi:transcription termination factor Rho [Gordonia sp. 852002-10350_SCH5691597]|uniref:transcription termination factor Rho n=1 Tax=Gordonia sp. 852002-10350_SCH5691597 TaxID=1834085 RepID=UPI0007EA5ECF|nr:transcription termination factor Rho [Gordonia sp. 852002-10350_SCH5691597]OBA65320.1 transcription termination factor Rho [Gordonia sp. 852002-10350_SCH5691597]